MRRLSQRAVAGLSALIVVVLVGGAAAALTLQSQPSGDDRDGSRLETTGVAAATGTMGEPLPPVPEATLLPPPSIPVTESTVTTVPPAVPPPPTVATTTSTTSAPTTSTTSAPTSTVPPNPPAPTGGRTFTLSPNSGPNNTNVVASGTGCVGNGAGAAIELVNPSGQGINGDGGSAMPDGTWRLPFSFYAGPPGKYPLGQYTVKAKCLVGATVLFEYAPQTFTLTA